MDNAAQKVKDWWEVADRTQRFVTVFGAGALIVLLVLTAYVMSKPRMTVLTSGLNAQDQLTAVNALAGEGIEVVYGKQGSIMVPSNLLNDARAAIEGAGVTTSTGGQDPFKLMFSGDMFEGTEQQNERVRFAKQSEIARTISTWEGVSSANVMLNMQKSSAFARSSAADSSSATVNITESGAGFGSSGGKAVAKLVQNATGISADNITVSNNYGQLLYDGDLLSQAGSGAGQKLQTELQESRRREQDLRRSLDLAFGPGNTIAMVQVELDMDVVTERKQTTTPSENPLTISTSDEAVTGGGTTSSGGAAGIASNQASAPASSGSTTTADPGEYSGKIKDEVYGQNSESISTTKATGGLVGMTVQVIVNSENVKDEQLKAVDSFVQAYLGGYKGQAGFAATVTSTTFDTEAAKAIEAAAASMQGSDTMQQAITLLPVLALIVVGFLVLRAITKVAADRRPGYALAAAGPQQFAQPQYPVNPQPRIQATPQHEALQDMPAPETEAGQALASAIEDGEINDALKIIEEMPEDDEIRAIRARINVPLEQIKHMAKTKPESVAMLLKGWMMEDLR